MSEQRSLCSDMVRVMRLERTRRLSHAPQTCLSTYSSTLAYPICLFIIMNPFPFVKSYFCFFGLEHFPLF